MLRKRNVNSGLSIINGIGDGLPNISKIHEKQREDEQEDKMDVDIPNKTRDSFGAEEQYTGFDDMDEKEILPQLSIYDLTPKAQLWWMNIFAFLCSIGLYIVYILYIYPCTFL